ncbi:MAG TPA: 2-amino-4-hydroxy-6-hydroxymethyldihydropteridine diphosphokinase [Pirellulales bacterium]|jgi:2-amino-4-hydroxy-6-hydroxymethyldihydropteridine diphosphokinase
MAQALVGLGSNIGDRQALLNRAVAELAASPHTTVLRTSRWLETQPVGGAPGQGEYLNGAVLLETSFTPQALHSRLKEIEAALGRARHERWGSRTIDLDLLLFDDLICRTPSLTLPHPRMAFRKFVIAPAAEIAPEMVHPAIGWSLSTLLMHLHTAPPYVAVSSICLAETRTLVSEVARETGWNEFDLPAGPEALLTNVPPSPPVAEAIEFLVARTKLLNGKLRKAVEAGETISSFWLESILAFGEVFWPGTLAEVWQAVEPVLIQPKLTVIYEVDSATGIADDVFQKLNAAQRVRAKRLGIGPVLWLDANSPKEAVAELTAAIQAME